MLCGKLHAWLLTQIWLIPTSFFNCMTPSWVTDGIMAPTSIVFKKLCLMFVDCSRYHRGSTCGFFLLWLQITIGSPTLFHCRLLIFCVLLYCFTDWVEAPTWTERIQSNLNSSKINGSFTMANSNSFLSPYGILPIAKKQIFREIFLFHSEFVCCVYSLESPH